MATFLATRTQTLALLQRNMISLREHRTLFIMHTAQTQIQLVTDLCHKLLGREQAEDQQPIWTQLDAFSRELQDMERIERRAMLKRDREEDTPKRVSKRLKAEELPRFNGELLEYDKWRTTVDDLVMRNDDLDQEAKACNLHNCLEGKALKRIGHYSKYKHSPRKLLKDLDRYYTDGEEIAKECRDLVRRAKDVHRYDDTEAWQGLYDLTTGLRALPMDRSTKQRIIDEVKAKLPKYNRHEFNENYDATLRELSHYLKVKLDSNRVEDLSGSRDERRKVPEAMGKGRYETRQANERGRRADFRGRRNKDSQAVFVIEVGKCIFCKMSHESSECPLTVRDRLGAIRNANLCFNCLEHTWLPGRRCSRESRVCSFNPCRAKNHKHHKWLCPAQQPNQVTVAIPKQTFLKTIVARVRQNNRVVFARVLIDSGAKTTVISKPLTQALDCQVKPSTVALTGLSSSRTNSGGNVEVSLQSLEGGYQFKLKALIVDSITEAPEEVPSDKLTDMLNRKQIRITEPNGPGTEFTQSISLIVGQEVAERLLTNTRVPLGPALSAYFTRLGWLISGNTVDLESHQDEHSGCVCLVLKRIFGIEEPEPEDVPLGIRFNVSKKRYYVRLPTTDLEQLCDNRVNAARQALRLRTRLTTRGRIDEYHQVMQEYLNNDHAELVPVESSNTNPESDVDETEKGLSSRPTYHIPHLPVIKTEATKTKIRAVFNASSRSEARKSLNQCLYKGPVANCDLFKCLLKIRSAPILMTTDLKKAFLQIRIEPRDRDLLRYYWFSDLSDEVPTLYRMKVVLFGAVCSPGILGAVLEHHLGRFQQTYPSVVRELRSGTYVDDVGMAAKQALQARSMIVATTKLFELASFQLHEWAVSCPEVEHITEPMYKVTCEDEYRNCLGLRWNPRKDLLGFKLDGEPQGSHHTRRTALSVISQLFDPLGLLLPFQIKLRLFARSLAMSKLDWDSPLNEEQNKTLMELEIQFSVIKDFTVRRYVPTAEDTELHIYCDANLTGLGAVAYTKTTSISDDQHLLCATGKLAPHKASTVPRLELCAAVMGAELMTNILCKGIVQPRSVHLYSDSQITLHRLNNDHQKYQLYVARRINKIQTECKGKAQWTYVNTKRNPADLITRGCSADKLITNRLWWNGRVTNRDEMPKEEVEDDELLHPVYFLQEEIDVHEKLLAERIETARTQLLKEWNQRSEREWGLVETEHEAPISREVAAEAELWRTLQGWLFRKEIQLIKNKVELPKCSKLRQWDPFLDKWGVLRARRRLDAASVAYDVKFPVVVQDHEWVRQHIESVHERLNHPGSNRTFEEINQHFLLFKGKQICRSITRKCKTCNQMRGKPFQVQPPPLPAFRVNQAKPFACMGVDYCGPITTYDGKKVYILLFTCAVTRAVELQLVCSLTADSCLMACERVFDKYGTPIEIHSDNATTFKRTNKSLAKILSLMEAQAQKHFRVRGPIKWVFQAPRAPWWGGFFERLVGTVKRTLDNTNIRKTFDYEEMQTIISSVQAIVNSRPLTESTMEEPALLPSHFLLGDSQTSMPPLPAGASDQGDDLVELYLKRCRRYNAFWNRWYKDYLVTLKNYWSNRSREPIEGELVLLQETNVPRMSWKTGKISKLIPGADGVVRTAEVMVEGQTKFIRAVQTLIPLECARGRMSGNGRRETAQTEEEVNEGHKGGDELDDMDESGDDADN